MKSNKLFAVFDISSSSVAGAHVLSKNDATTKAVFLASSRSDAVSREEMDIKRFLEDTLVNLEIVIKNIQKADVHHPPYIQVALSSPWYRSQTRSITYKKSTPFVCTNKLVNDLIEKEIEHVLKNEPGPFGDFGTESVIIERQVSQIKLNGYHTSSPFGKKIDSLEIFLTITMAPKGVLNRFMDTIRKFYGPREIRFSTAPFAAFVVTRDIMPELRESVVIDIGEEVTDIAFIKDEIFSYQHSFPIGTYALYRKLSKKGAKVEEARALVESYRLEKLADTEKQKVSKAVTEFADEWRASLHQVLDNGHYGLCMPQSCFIISDPKFENIFAEVIKNDEFVQHACGTTSVDTYSLSSDIIKESIKSSDGKEIDTPLAMTALFVEKIS